MSFLDLPYFREIEGMNKVVGGIGISVLIVLALVFGIFLVLK